MLLKLSCCQYSMQACDLYKVYIVISMKLGKDLTILYQAGLCLFSELVLHHVLHVLSQLTSLLVEELW